MKPSTFSTLAVAAGVAVASLAGANANAFNLPQDRKSVV